MILVHGAFGCGKSYLLVSLIWFMASVLDLIGDTETKILVSTLTNVAVDWILIHLLESGFTDFARVGSMKNISKILLPYSHHQSTKEMKTDKEAIHELKDMIKELSN